MEIAIFALYWFWRRQKEDASFESLWADSTSAETILQVLNQRT